MTPDERRAVTILYVGVIPLSLLAIDVWLYASMRGWTYNVQEHGTDAFWPIVLALGGILFPIAAFLAGNALFDLWRARTSRRWRLAEGRVTDTAVEEIEYSPGRWIIGYGNLTYAPKVTYTYEVAGRTYSGNFIAFGLGEFMMRGRAARALQPYRKGALVNVRYDPKDPGTSVLETTSGWALKGMLFACGTAAAPFVIALVMISR